MNTSPQEVIAELIRQGEKLRDEAIRALSSEIYSDGTSIIRDLIVKTVVPRGFRGFIRGLEKTGRKMTKANLNTYWLGVVDKFLEQCESQVKQMSIKTRNLTVSGNSSRLLRKFNRVHRLKGPIARLDAIIAVLREIQNLDLIWNKDIPEEIARRKAEADAERSRKAILKESSPELVRLASAIELHDFLSIAKPLDKYPTVKQSIIGALDRLQSNAPDAERHCIISCRTAIEELCIQIGGDRDWKKALNNIFPSETDRKAVKGVWNYLSGKGAHGGHTPTKREAEYGLQLTIATLMWIIDRFATS